MYSKAMNYPEDLIYIDDYGLVGSNFYWHKYESKGLTKEDIFCRAYER